MKPKTFHTLVKEDYKTLLRISQDIVKYTAIDAEDILQIALLAQFRNLRHLQEPVGKPFVLLRAQMRRKIRWLMFDMLRYKPNAYFNHKSLDDDNDHTLDELNSYVSYNPSTQISIILDMHRAIDLLEPPNDEIVRLYLKGYTMTEIGQQVGMSGNTVKWRFTYKIKPQLQQALKAYK